MHYPKKSGYDSIMRLNEPLPDGLYDPYLLFLSLTQLVPSDYPVRGRRDRQRGDGIFSRTAKKLRTASASVLGLLEASPTATQESEK